MNVGGIGPVGGSATVYSVSSPYLNGVVRQSDAVTAANAQVAVAAAATLATQNAAAARAQAALTATPAAPFDNPAIAQIAQQTAVVSSLSGDAGTLVQAYGAVALIEPPLALAPIYAQPIVPAVPPVAPVTRTARISATA